MWNCPNNSIRGCRLKNFIDNHDLSIAHPDTPTSLWHCQKLFRKNRPNIPSLSTSSGVANSDDQKANILAITLKDNFAENKRPGNGGHPIDKEITKTLENFFSSPPTLPLTPTDPTEICEYIRRLKNNKAPGSDQITNKMVKNFNTKTLLILTYLINKILFLRHFPNNWKNAIVFPIKKPDKNAHNPSSYRPISLVSVLSKITEYVILNRLKSFTNDNNFINPNQYGFTRNLSTYHPLLGLTEKITAGFQRGRSTGTVFLDIQKAFDRVWKENKIFTDSFRRETEINLLIGADVLGKLLTGNSVELESGLTAVETKPGISCPTEIEKQKTELSLNDFNNRMKILPDGRYEVELPWKYDSLKLPSNKELVWKRHEGMINRFGCGKFFIDYQKVFQDWEKLNIIERVPDLELNKECHYLAHRPVIKLDSQTTKIRPVFDASASEKGKPSLNECLLKGTNLIELIPDILDRFRMYPIGISADIEKAFLMLSVAPKDRDFLRFFSPCSEGRIVYRHCRVVFGVSSSPFLLNASIMHLLENCQPQHEEVAQKLKCSFYVDNCVSGVFNTDEQGRFIEHAKLIMLNGCFNLRGFENNVAGKNVDRSSGDTSVLGVIWNLETDTLKCCTDMDTLTCETKITKRLILAIVQKIFDPIGLLTPATLLPKLLIQHLGKMKIAWDSELSPNDVNVFLKWLRDLYVLKDVTLSRCMIINSTSELHVFVDASKEAYAACVFVRSMFKSDVKVTLVRAKVRVAPLKPLSIPRLELMACCIGSRLANSIVNALNLPNLRITFWSDSTTALWWIKEKGSWSVFVENRVKEIRQLTRGHLWKHVPGNLNIADLLSRGCSRQMLISRWWEGPLWVRESPEYWPLGETPGDSEEVELERKKLKVVNIDLSRDAPPWHLYAISDYSKMIRVFSWVLRFVNNCTLLNGKCKDFELSQLEIENSEKKLIRLVQSYYLPDAKSSNYIETYIDDEGILRVKTKILNRDDERSFLYPILLPEKFKSMSSEPTPLPPDRVTDCAPFEIVGIDLAGAFIFERWKKSVDKTLFTCAVYRAIHLELVNSLTSDAFLLALRCFIARRGRPRTIYCDNGTNFRGAFNDLSKLNWSKIVEETRTPKILWKFIPPTAARWGGWWERLVRTVKELLKRTLGRSVLKYDELYTVLCDCESIINCRPLTYMSENPEEFIPLTPSMFLISNKNSNIEDIRIKFEQP
ncbi:probable RNA-directed DNA polymerase from transposon X-element [Trichonephila clavipes]|nr:probable RNA-directed DNA polymerase from transposon X-element [Trichonephila clavipes]